MSTRLIAEAEWLESVAEDERATGVFLEELSTAHSILHDLKLDGVQGNVDHVVVGPGGAFVVVTRRFAQPLTVSGSMLYSGDRPLRPEFDALKVVAARLADTLGTPVMPVMAFHGGVLPASAPQEVDGVYVCAVENVVRVVTRASHTLLAPHKVTEITERAVPHLFNPASVPRHQAEPPKVAAPATISPWIPETPATPAGRDDEALSILRKASGVTAPTLAAAAPAAAPSFAQLDASLTRQPAAPTPAPAPVMSPSSPTSLTELSRMSMSLGATDSAPADGVAPASTGQQPQQAKQAKQAKQPKQPKPPKAAKLPKEPGAARSRGFTVAIVLSLCLVAATVGAGLAVMQNGDDTDQSQSTVASTTTTIAGSTVPAGPMAAGLAAPAVSFSASCLTPGTGWDWIAAWPGDLAGLTQYDVEFQNADGSWTASTPLTSSAVTFSSLGGQPPSSTVTFRITAVMQDGSRSVNQAVAFTAPAESC